MKLRLTESQLHTLTNAIIAYGEPLNDRVGRFSKEDIADQENFALSLEEAEHYLNCIEILGRIAKHKGLV